MEIKSEPPTKVRYVLFQLTPTRAFGNLPSLSTTTKFGLTILHVSLTSFWTGFIYLFIFNLFNVDKLTYIFDIWR